MFRVFIQMLSFWLSKILFWDFPTYILPFKFTSHNFLMYSYMKILQNTHFLIFFFQRESGKMGEKNGRGRNTERLKPVFLFWRFVPIPKTAIAWTIWDWSQEPDTPVGLTHPTHSSSLATTCCLPEELTRSWIRSSGSTWFQEVWFGTLVCLVLG